MSVKRERVTTYVAEAENGAKSEVVTNRKDASAWRKTFKKENKDVKTRIVTNVNLVITKEGEWK